MSIRSEPLLHPSDQQLFISKFEAFGSCSIDFKVTLIQPKGIYVTYPSYSQALQAYSSLNSTSLSSGPLKLQLLLSDKEDPPKAAQKVPDIEIIIPSAQINFLSTPTYDLTPTGSYHSPCFPDNSQSPVDSPQNSPRPIEILRNDSPVSVASIPNGNHWKLTLPCTNYAQTRNEKAESSDALLLRKKCETISIVVPKKRKEQRVEMVFCSVCERTVKKKSFKAHNISKIHQANLKMN